MTEFSLCVAEPEMLPDIPFGIHKGKSKLIHDHEMLHQHFPPIADLTI